MDTLSKQQAHLIEELRDDIEFYREELKSQIQSARTAMFIGVGLAIVVGVILFINPEWVAKVQSLSEHMGTITGLIGEFVPVTLASKSFNNSKTQKKKLSGLRTFEKELSRMEMGILPNQTENILELESEFIRYITT